jgi:hypothetical protein
MRRSQCLVRRALRTARRLTGRLCRAVGRVSCALGAGQITGVLRHLGFQVIDLCLEGFQIRTTYNSGYRCNGSRDLYNARTLHKRPLWVVDSGFLANGCDSGEASPYSSDGNCIKFTSGMQLQTPSLSFACDSWSVERTNECRMNVYALEPDSARKFSSCSGSAAASEASGAALVGTAGTVPADFQGGQGAQRGSSRSCVVFSSAAARKRCRRRSPTSCRRTAKPPGGGEKK